jgi:anti-sigma factor RsiW
MTLHPDVLRDLLTLYLAGEASPATRELVEEHLARDPELARLASEAASEDDRWTRAGRQVEVAPSVEKAALETTRRTLRLRSMLLAVAITLTLLPFSFVASREGIDFVLLTAAPRLASLLWAGAVGFWIAFWRVSRRLRVTGL